MMGQRGWLPRWLFRCACGIAGLLVLAVLVAPALAGWAEAAEGEPPWARIVLLFARDATVRQISLASALGLVATACTFFTTSRPRGE
jgi:hypothetical protein